MKRIANAEAKGSRKSKSGQIVALSPTICKGGEACEGVGLGIGSSGWPFEGGDGSQVVFSLDSLVSDAPSLDNRKQSRKNKKLSDRETGGLQVVSYGQSWWRWD